MVDKKLAEYLNKAIGMELQVAIQYMWQHIIARGLKSAEISDKLRKIAVEEMQHTERLAERLDYLGGTPTTQPEKITVGLELKKMMELDAKAESDTIKFYKEALDYCEKLKDPVSKRLFEDLLVDEEGHHNFFETMLEGN
ncbi:MAG: ferritin-like domain-containing protein [Candidatus ainarchaeum sp.]|nr:ferritin-like domain-containing protein [Candidatus ainarchaeum sp.]